MAELVRTENKVPHLTC